MNYIYIYTYIQKVIISLLRPSTQMHFYPFHSLYTCLSSPLSPLTHSLIRKVQMVKHILSPHYLITFTHFNISKSVDPTKPN